MLFFFKFHSRSFKNLALSLQKNVHVGPARAGRPKTARSLKFINKNKSTKFGFGYRPKSEIFEEQEKPVADNDVGNETDSDVSQEESDQNDAPVMKKRKLSQTAVPQRRSPRIANLKMAKSTTKNARSKSMTKDLEKTAAAMPKKRATRSRKRSRSNARSRSRSKSTRARKSSKASKSAPRKRRATKRRSRSMKK